VVGHSIKNKGFEAEQFVMNKFRNQGFHVQRIDDYYDIRISKNGKTKRVEIKSCNLIVKMKKDVLSTGRYDWTCIKNRSLQRSNNVDICFVVCIGDSFEILGFISAKSLKAKRYVLLTKIMKTRITRFNKYCQRFINI